MSEHDFQAEVIDRLARLETKIDATMATVADHGEKLNDHSIKIEGVCNSVKSAHKRIDGIYCAAAGIGGICGWLAEKLPWGK